MTTPEFGVPSTGFLVWQLSLRWQVQLSRALAPLGITHTDYAVLASLHGLTRAGVRPSQRELADVSGLEPMYVSRLARSLEEAGLVVRDRHAADPRAIELSLTDAGVGVVTAARRTVQDLDAQRLAALGGTSSERVAQLQEALLDLLRQAREHAADSDASRPPPRGRRQTTREKDR